MGVTPEGMGCVKMTLNARNNVLVYFNITTLTLLYFLRLQREGTIAPPPLNPPLISVLVIVSVLMLLCVLL